PLELFFDLTFVVAVGRAADSLHHELAVDHVATALAAFAATFFAVWWAWMNFTWFASAHDSDDVAFRLLALVQMAGVLVLAARGTSARTAVERCATRGRSPGSWCCACGASPRPAARPTPSAGCSRWPR